MKSNIKNKIRIVFSIIILVIVTSCHKEGIGGKSSVSGVVAHHGKPIPYSVVYIMYGATDFPGLDASKYDDHTTSDANAHYEFNNLRKGNYYLFGVGFDNSISQQVSGGSGIKLKYNKSETADVAVTE
jgi:hypothetical protein